MRAHRLLAIAGALLLGAPAASASEVCEAPPSTGPVSLMILKSGRQVQELAAALGRGAPVAARDAETVIFRDGRVLTADLDGASRMLNRLGWSKRRLEVVASFPKRRARPARRRG